MSDSTNALDQLVSHFESREKKQIDCDIITDAVYAKPPSPQDYLEVQSINQEKNSAVKTRRMAKYVATHVVDSEGNPAFGKANDAVIQKLSTKVDGKVLFSIFAQLFSDEVSDEVEELEKKSEESDSAS